jgi:hypothetical protein
MNAHYIFFLALLSLWAQPVLAASNATAYPPQNLIYDQDEGETAQDETAMEEPNHAPIQPLVVPPSALQPTTPAAIAAPHREEAVEKNELAAPVLTNYGILDEKSGALPMDIWKNISYSDATASLRNATQAIAGGNGNNVFQNIVRAAALSKTYEPSGAAENANAFFNARVMAAQASGARDGALQLLAKRSEAFKPEDWKAFIESDLRARRITQACALAPDKLAQDTSSFVQKLAIICDIADGKVDAARLHLDVLREAGETDVLFLELAERAQNPKAKLTRKLENLSVMHLAVIAAGPTKMKPELLEGVLVSPQPVMLGMGLSDVQRLKLAENFARNGQISATEYASLLDSMKYPPKAIAQFRTNPAQLLTVPEKEWPAALRRAAALRAMKEEENTLQKAHIIASSMPGYSNADLLGALGDVLQGEISGIAALPDNAAAAPMMARFLLLRGDKDAENWWRMASAMPANREALLSLFPLALLRGVISDDARGAWFESYSRTQNFSSDRKNYNLALVKSLGVMLPSDIDSQIAANSIFPVMDAKDNSISGILSNVSQDTNDATLRAVLALKAMRLHKLAETLVLLKL